MGHKPCMPKQVVLARSVFHDIFARIFGGRRGPSAHAHKNILKCFYGRIVLPLPNSPVNCCHESQYIPSGAVQRFQLRRQRNVRRLYGHVSPSSRDFVLWRPPDSCCGPCAATASRRNPGRSPMLCAVRMSLLWHDYASFPPPLFFDLYHRNCNDIAIHSCKQFRPTEPALESPDLCILQ